MDDEVRLVELGDYSRIARLIAPGAPGRARRIGNRFWLEGSFALEILGTPSEGVTFDPSRNDCEIRQWAEAWQVVAIRERTFPFATLVTVPDRPPGPLLRFDKAVLFSRPHTVAPYFLMLPNARVDLTDDPAAQRELTLRYPTHGGGAASVQLDTDHIPEPGMQPGVYLLPFVTGFTVYLGALSRSATLDHIPGVRAVLPQFGFVNFRFWESPRGDPNETRFPLIVRATELGNALSVVFAPNSRIQIRTSSTSGRSISLNEMRGGQGWLTGVDYRKGVVALNKLSASGSTMAQLLTAPDSLRLHIPLVAPVPGSSHEKLAQLLCHDPSIDRPVVDEPARDARRRLYRGLSVAGFGNHRSSSAQSSARLDASWVRFALVPGVVPEVHVMAGHPNFSLPPPEIVRQGSGPLTVVSRLVPKQDDFTQPGGSRTLRIPCAGTLLRTQTSGAPPRSSFSIDTQANRFSIAKPEIELLPVGSAAFSTAPETLDDPSDYARLIFADPSGAPDVELRFQPDGLRPAKGPAWLDEFQPRGGQFGLYDHPGGTIIYPGTSEAFRSSASGSTSLVTVVKGPDGREFLAYTALSLVTAYKLIPGFGEWVDRLRDNLIKIEVGNLADTPTPPWVVGNEVDDLTLIYTATPNSQDAVLLRSFIDLNMKSGVAPDEDPKRKFDEYTWPFAAGLALILWRKEQPSPQGVLRDVYPETIASLRSTLDGNPPVVRLGFDMSSKQALPAPRLGWQQNWWGLKRELADPHPTLWPRLSNTDGARLDPSDPLWRGYFFRQFPLTLTVATPPDPCTLLGRFFNAVNESLVLDYGWKDETGTTFKATLFANPPIELQLGSQADALKILLTAFECLGTGNKPAYAQGRMTIVLPAIKYTDRGVEKDLELEGIFGFDLSKGFSFDYIDFVVRGDSQLSTKSIPGFAEITIVRVRSDFRRVSLDMKLKPDTSLANIMPGLANDGDLLDAMITLDLEGSEGFDVAVTLPAGRRVRLFGIWPIEVQGMRLQIQPDMSSLKLRCGLAFGIPGLEAVRVDLVISRAGNGDWTFNIDPVSVSGSISLPGFTITALLDWSTTAGDTSAIPAGPNLPTKGRERAFWGALTLKSDLAGDISLAVRINGEGRQPSWVAAFWVDRSINLGIGRLNNPVVLLASRADLDGKLAATLQKVETPIIRSLLPREGGPGDQLALREWLERWRPSNDVGLLFAASSELEIHEAVATATDDREKRTTIVISDSGLVRVDAWVKLFGIYDQSIGIAVNFPEKFIAASFQGPSLAYPPGTNEYKVSAGEISLRLGFGDRKAFRLTVGWPIVGDNIAHEDWSKAVEVRWDGAFPINTFSGGIVIDYENDPQNGEIIRIGIALRAGWTKEYSKEIISSRLAKASATLAVFVGGILYFRFKLNGARGFELLSLRRNLEGEDSYLATRCQIIDRLRALECKSGHEANRLRALYALLRDDLEAISSTELAMVSVLFAEVHGHAAAELLGVTIASVTIRVRATFFACGDTRQGIVKVYTEVGFSVTVRIACVAVEGSAKIRLDLLNRGECRTLAFPFQS